MSDGTGPRRRPFFVSRRRHRTAPDLINNSKRHFCDSDSMRAQRTSSPNLIRRRYAEANNRLRRQISRLMGWNVNKNAIYHYNSVCGALYDGMGSSQWRRLHGAMGGGRAPHFYKWLGTRGTVSRSTSNKKLTKLYWSLRKRSPKRLIVLIEPKSAGARPKRNFFRCPHFCSGPVPLTFKFVPAPVGVHSNGLPTCKACHQVSPYSLLKCEKNFANRLNSLCRWRLSPLIMAWE